MCRAHCAASEDWNRQQASTHAACSLAERALATGHLRARSTATAVRHDGRNDDFTYFAHPATDSKFKRGERLD